MTRDRTLEPARLSSAQRDALAEELYAVHRQIFDGVDAASFRDYVLEPQGARTRLQVFRGLSGEAVGYIAIHQYVRFAAGERALVLRSEVGLLPAYRGRAPQARFVLLETARAWLLHLRLPKYVFACPVHPSSYYGVTRRAHASWPRPGRVVPPSISQLMTELGESFGLPQVPGGDPLVRAVGWITKESPDERTYWAGHRAKEVQFYRQTNPGYAKGHGLLMIVPVTVPLVARAFVGQIRERIRRFIRSKPVRRGLPAR